MGIDFYLRWADQTTEEHDAQITGFATTGEAGYIREAYHGGPYLTKVLCPESWDVPEPILPADPVKDEYGDPDSRYYGVVITGPDGGPGFWPGQRTISYLELEQRLPEARKAALERGRNQRDPEWGQEQADAATAFVAKAKELVESSRQCWILNSY